VNVWADLMNDKLIGPFLFLEKTVTGCPYLDILELYALPKLPPHTILQQDGALPHFCHYVRNHLDKQRLGYGSEKVNQLLGLLRRQI
jgi:hypothetical protein